MTKLTKLLASAVAAATILFAGCDSEYYNALFGPEPTTEIRLQAALQLGGAIEILDQLSEDKNYHIYVDSFGGSAFDVLPIVNRLQELKNDGYQITTESYGYCMSAGAVIFALGDVRIAHEGGVFMFHGAGTSSVYGGRKSLRNPDDLDPTAKRTLELLDAEIIKVFSSIGLDDETVNYLLYSEDFLFVGSLYAYNINFVTDLVRD